MPESGPRGWDGRMQVEGTPQRRAARHALMRQGVVVLYEDNHILGISKAAGLLAQGGPEGEVPLTALVDRYRRRAEGKPGQAYVGLVHRLDRNVSGAMVVAKTSKAASRLSQTFRERAADLEKTYLAWVERTPEVPERELVHRLRREKGVTLIAAEGDDDGKTARLRYRVVGRGNLCARLEIELGTGLPHQIRVQLSYVGHPIWGDVKYGGTPWGRLGLHALRLVVPHPVGGEPVAIDAPVPKELQELDERRKITPHV